MPVYSRIEDSEIIRMPYAALKEQSYNFFKEKCNKIIKSPPLHGFWIPFGAYHCAHCMRGVVLKLQYLTHF